jgi:outer membrane protein OmpA-like peptidoglycan-associated protein
MSMRFWLGVAASLCVVGAFGQGVAYGADAPAFGADELAAILTPAPVTRGLTPGSGVSPGDPGSGVVPDLKVEFEFDSVELTPSARVQLDELSEAIQKPELTPYRFRVAGHTDAVGSDKYNDWLSQMRAASVVSYLSEGHGIAIERLEAMGFGERELADPAHPRSGINRRVEVRTLQ